MIRSLRKYDVEVRERTLYGETVFGVLSRFLYTDREGQDWVRMDGEWYPVDDRYADIHVYTHQAPKGPLKAEDSQFESEEDDTPNGWDVTFDEAAFEQAY